MLPHVARTTGVNQPSPALPAGSSGDAAVRPVLSAAALANLRAEVLLRLIETMLKHMPRTAEPNPGRDLLETLLAALKTLPGREGESARKFADIVSRLPPELRPSVEKLVGTVLSAMPTRSLVEIVRDPNGPAAQKLATVLAAGLPAEDLAATGAERQSKPLALNAQQLAAVARHGAQHTAQAAQTPGDVRALQTALKRIFDLDGNGRGRAAPVDAGEAEAGEAGPSRTSLASGGTSRPEPRPATAKSQDGQPVNAAAAALRHQGGAEDVDTARRETAPARARIANTAGQALARGMQAIARDVSPEALMQAVAHLMETLSPEEATFLRALLDRPLGAEIEQELAQIVREQAEDGAKPGKAQTEAAAQPRAAPEPDKAAPMPPAREAVSSAILAEAAAERLVAAPVLRDGVPLAFVPYLPAEDDVEWPQPHQADEDEADEQNPEDAGEGNGEEQAQGEGEPPGEEPESPDMARRREKTADMVGVMEPGLVFYQKLGDYWT
ncbi:hypothetical protein [Shinella sp.]|uniref:hypothetical protein n=1 Tax=Shinella sp. TaxID=1870904 RepID=UPI00301CADC3